MNTVARVATLSILAISCSLTATQAQAVEDYKAINAVVCQPYGPNTVVSELTYSQKGVTNPGTTNESVLCAINSDGDSAYSSTPGAGANMYAFYQAGSIPGRAACTLFVSNAAMVPGPVYSVTVNPANVPAGTRSALVLLLADTSGGLLIGAPSVALCTITPKATLAGFTFLESDITNKP